MEKYFLLLCAANTLAYLINCSMILWPKAEAYKTLIALIGGSTVTYLYITATQVGYACVNKLWTLKVFGFAISTTIFTILTWMIMNEAPTWKHLCALVLAGGIVYLYLK